MRNGIDGHEYKIKEYIDKMSLSVSPECHKEYIHIYNGALMIFRGINELK